ncbi:hypothetical protein QN277_005626 [Acacia crassicarpa]|uniref:TIR domain-containing protein n=1 Tax=Acacia crassicarpa TaxID=499986 RepID=A0AAE1JTZ3_9FABA|nr:hypothetical protein QN277_005626 [Acacia crassicarpa]
MDATIALTLIEAVLILLAIAISKAITLISPLDDSSKDVESIPTVSSPSNIIVASPATKYNIFLSFRGEDTRNTFSSYLYEALCNANIHTFMDHKLHKGDNISPILLKTIEESDISLIIFSKDYASSTWCMDELVHIMKCKDQYGRIVIPIFYNVDPSSVRKQNGSFGDGFAKLKQRFKHDQERVQEWKNALMRSTNLSGWDSKNIRPEPKLIKMIVKDILSKLHNKSSFHLEGLVGIDYHIQKVEGLLSGARIVGIWGMGGIGKTTLAKAVFDRLTAQFESFYFAKGVRQQVENKRLDELQEKCLKELFKDEDINTYNLGSTFVKERLQRKKILLVLDDVDDAIAIEDLIKACGWFGEGSRIIITSRDEQVLKNTSVLITYHVPQLDHHHAFHLFSLKAFKQDEPLKSYLELSKWVVDYCDGNPLALTVLGCFLHGRGKKEWESAVEKLNQTLHKDIFNVLKLSFDRLDDTQKNVFLDLAFFLNEAWGISLEDCTRCLYDSSAYIELSVLEERSLILVSEEGDIEMHALLVEMGLEISRQQFMSNPEKPIRLQRHKDIYHVFNNDKAIEAIRCMSLDVSKIKSITLKASTFQKICNIIFLKIYKSDSRKPSMLNVRGVLDYLSEELRFLSWEECPLPYVPLHFCAENLITLEMRDSNIRQLWNENQHFPNLQEIDLSHSKHLTALPDLSQAPKIKALNLNGCANLAQIHSLTFPGKVVNLIRYDCGPMQIKVGGNIKGRSSGFVIVLGYLDLRNLSFDQVTMKLFVCGNMICGVRLKHEVMPLEEKEDLRKEAQSLGSLLPFVREVEWFEGPIEFGHDFNQHYHYSFSKEERGDRGEMNGHQLITMSLMEDDEEDDVLMEGVTFIRVPNSITRWSLLKQLKLKSPPLSDECCRKIKPRLGVTLSFPENNPPSPLPWLSPSNKYDTIQQRGFTFPYPIYFSCGTPDSIYGTFIVCCGDIWRGINIVKAMH